MEYTDHPDALLENGIEIYTRASTSFLDIKSQFVTWALVEDVKAAVNEIDNNFFN